MAGGDAAGHQEPRFPSSLEIAGIDRVTVNGAVVQGRHVERRDKVFGQNAADGIAKGHGFGSGHRSDAGL